MEERAHSSGHAKPIAPTADTPPQQLLNNDDRYDDNSQKDALDEARSQLDDSGSSKLIMAHNDNDDEPPENENHDKSSLVQDRLDLEQQQQQLKARQQQHTEHKNHKHQQTHIQLLMNALEKLDPDKNGLFQVTKEIVSSTLTTRLRAVCKINRLIDHSNDLCHSFHEIGAQRKFQESANKFRDWILRNKIIEHIFGPNCHVEIIKQSHTILNFVAYSLNDGHVNVIWSASTLKHCGRQVLDLLTSLIRFMRTGPVLHLYLLVKNLNIEDHSEHTLILTSHILRYIWSHSPCINQTGTDSSQPPDEFKRSVVDHILKSISDTGSSQISSQQNSKQSLVGDASNDYTNSDQTTQSNRRKQRSTPQPCHQQNDDSTADDREWLGQLKGNDFLDNASDLSACCSEDKNMDDFDDDAQSFVQQDSMTEPEEVQDDPGINANDHSELYSSLAPHRGKTKLIRAAVMNEPSGSTSGVGAYNRAASTPTSADSETKFVGSYDQNNLEHIHHLSVESIDEFKEMKLASLSLSTFTTRVCTDEDVKALSEYNLSNLNEPGKTLLWDLLQDDKIEQLATNLHIEVENVLVNLVMSFGDRCIRYRFIEACLENLSVGNSVIISLRLLPKLMSFNTVSRNLSRSAIDETHQWQSETHAIVLWAEREYNMSENFFKNLVEYYKGRQRLMDSRSGGQSHDVKDMALVRQSDELGEHDGKSSIFTHIEKLIIRMSFLTFIYSKQFSPETMRLSKEQVDQLWDCLAYDSNIRCSDVLFQWIYQQAVGDDYHGVNDDSLDYVLKYKLPTLSPEHFRLRGLKLLEQLLWIRQDYECCHNLEHPATKLLWDIALKAVDDELSMAAIRILNHFYIYTNHQKTIKCDKGVNFMRYCMDHLDSCLSDFNNNSDAKKISHSLDIMQKVILLVRTHLEVFRTHWSYYLRTLQINNEADLISHRFNVYEIKLTMTIRLICQAASSMDKTTIEVQANDCIGELRAEIVKWWYSQVDRNAYEQSTSFSPSSSSTSSVQSNVLPVDVNDDVNNSRRAQQQKSQPQQRIDRGSRASSNNANSLNSFTEFLLLNHHSLRLLSHNQEIPFEWDSRQINELDFKDMQVVYVLNDTTTNIDSVDDLASDKSNESSNAPQIAKTEIPSLLLLNHDYFERLMEANRILGSFRCDVPELTTRAKTLSRRVWEIIQILPTCPHYKEDLKRCGLSDNDWRLKTDRCSSLLNSECPQRLLYSLQIIDILRSSSDHSNWASVFIRKGGLSDIYDVFMSQKLLPNENEDWNEWLQECLAYLLKLLFQFGTRTTQASPNESLASSSSNKISSGLTVCSNRLMSSNGSIKRIRRNRNRSVVAADDRILLPQFSEELLVLLEDTNLIFNKLIWILKSSALCRNQSDQYYYSAMTSRAMIVNHVMSFMSSWCKSDPRFPEFAIEDYQNLLKALILDDTDASTRREACHGFFKLHYACLTRPQNVLDHPTAADSTSLSSINSQDSGLCQSEGIAERRTQSSHVTNKYFSADFLRCLIKFLPITEKMRPPKPIRNYATENEYIREMYSPGCKDYFWLLCRLLDSPTNVKLHKRRVLITNQKAGDGEDSKNSAGEAANVPPIDNYPGVDLFRLCEYLVVAIRNRPTYESRDFTVEDDTLKGMLHLMVMAIKRDPTFKYTTQAYDFVQELFEYLFAPPTPKERYLPRCKAPTTRSTAFDLMIALVERCPKNYFRLLDLLFADQHNSVVKSSYPTDYWPHDECRSEVGFVGLINLGATCYLATCMQHLFMIPDLRYAILSIEDTKPIRHGEIIRELQKIFTFMLESERKAYNPRNFCKVYTMDNHPLNIAEQTDMTEFLTDLMTKLEESSPRLRQIIKGLFSGTLSNNVVSLDCPHISRTTEEFYTLRVQVADMRNLNDSLDELTVKDTLEGDNMYTCSTCEKKVRAEKRACIVKLPRILCFNTMRYTFNMATMTKEKVNTHFSFPLKLDMADYLESVLMKRQQTPSNCARSTSSPPGSSASSSTGSATTPTQAPESCNITTNVSHDCPSEALPKVSHSPMEHQNINDSSVHSTNKSPTPSQMTTSGSPSSVQSCGDGLSGRNEEDSETMYELIGVTVHTGNADGGHYYCFIRDCEDQSSDKPRWYLFNDAEVKPFDDSHIGTECYGGELTTKSYDAMNDRFVDFSIEKTNSAYMLFYKRIDYKYSSRSVALRYIESDTQRSSFYACHSQQPIDHSGSDQAIVDTKEGGSNIAKDAKAADKNTVKKDNEVQNSVSNRNDVSNSSSSDLALNFNKFYKNNYENFTLPKHLENWIWSDNMKFARDKSIFEHHYFNFMWQICANVPCTLNQLPEHLVEANNQQEALSQVSDDAIAIRTVHLAIAFVLGVLMNSRERPNLSNWTELIRKQFNTSQAACEWLMQLIDDEETWLKQMLMKCPIEMVKQLFQRLCNDLTGSKQHKKLRLVK